MNPQNLANMSSDELEQYAAILGVTLRAARGEQAKADLIERRRARIAHVRAVGCEFDIPIKRAHGQRVADAIEEHTDESLLAALRLLLGDEQFGELVRACTDEDGTEDADAMAMAVVQVLNSDELKNF